MRTTAHCFRVRFECLTVINSLMTHGSAIKAEKLKHIADSLATINEENKRSIFSLIQICVNTFFDVFNNKLIVTTVDLFIKNYKDVYKVAILLKLIPEFLPKAQFLMKISLQAV